MTKFIGEPYAGKLHVRFDEGAEKEFVFSFSLYSTVTLCNFERKELTQLVPIYRESYTEITQRDTEKKVIITVWIF